MFANRVLGVSIQVVYWMLNYMGNWILVLDSACFGRASMVAFMACLTMVIRKRKREAG